MYQTTAPTRVDLAGGTFDIWPIHQVFKNPCTVNVAVSLNAKTTLQPTHNSSWSIESIDQNQKIEGHLGNFTLEGELPLLRALIHPYLEDLPCGFNLKTECKSPAGAGVGGSSCLAITVIKALFEWLQIPHEEEDLVRTVRDIEAKVIHTPTGVQDYWGAVRGGANILSWPPGKEDVQTYSWPEEWNQSLVLCYSGKPRQSAFNNWELFRRVFDKNERILNTFSKMAEQAQLCAQAIRNQNFSEVLTSSKQEWELRKSLWPNLETAETKMIHNACMEQGAEFTRICGAGGGGVMLILSSPENRAKVIQAAQSVGGVVLDAAPTNLGLYSQNPSFPQVHRNQPSIDL